MPRVRLKAQQLEALGSRRRSHPVTLVWLERATPVRSNAEVYQIRAGMGRRHSSVCSGRAGVGLVEDPRIGRRVTQEARPLNQRATADTAGHTGCSLRLRSASAAGTMFLNRLSESSVHSGVVQCDAAQTARSSGIAITASFIHHTALRSRLHFSSIPKNFFFAKHIHHLFGEPSSLNKHCNTRCSRAATTHTRRSVSTQPRR